MLILELDNLRAQRLSFSAVGVRDSMLRAVPANEFLRFIFTGGRVCNNAVTSAQWTESQQQVVCEGSRRPMKQLNELTRQPALHGGEHW